MKWGDAMNIDVSSYKRGKTGVIACAKDEAPWLLEWIAHYKSLGFDEIAIATNDCSDGTDEICAKMAELGHIHHIDNAPPYEEDTRFATGFRNSASIQYSAYYRLQQLIGIRDCEWLMTADLDEFLVIHKGNGRIQDLIDGKENIDSIVIDWKIFGDSGRSGMIEEPITHTLFGCSLDDDPRVDLFNELTRYHSDKTLTPHMAYLRPLSNIKNPLSRLVERLQREATYHYASYNSQNYRIRKSDGIIALFDKRFAQREHYTEAQMNHYALRTHEICARKKLRGNAHNRDKTQWIYDEKYHHIFNRNEATDRSILKYKAGLLKNLADFRKDKTISALERNAKVALTAKLKPFSFSNETLNFLPEPNAPDPEALKSVRPSDLPSIVLLAPSCSGSNQLAQYLFLLGAYTPPPHTMPKSAQAPLSFEPLRLKKEINRIVHEKTLSMNSNSSAFEKFFEPWMKQQILSAHSEGCSCILLKHRALIKVLPLMTRAINAKFVVLHRDLQEIEKERLRRNQKAFFGKSGATKIYQEVKKYRQQTAANMVDINYEDFIGNANSRERLVAQLELSPTASQLADAEEFISGYGTSLDRI